MRRAAFTLIELIFVIVIMGILAKFGVEFLAQAYNSFIFSNINSTLQSQSAAAVETIASRLQYRIKDSVIARETGGAFSALSGYTAGTATILEWIGTDIEGLRGDSMPLWSGIIDLGLSSAATLKSPGTDTTALDALIDALSDGGSSISDAAIYFVGSDSDINNYGWNGVALADHNTSVMHPINAGAVDEFISGIGGVDFSGVDIYEYYQLAWSAYAVELANGNLILYYDYQPWNGESYTNGKSTVIMEDVSTFQFIGIGSIVKIQICTKTALVNDYSLCKEKTIF
ncbi:MAG: protein containing prepilin-type N- cleavage/methylation domain protein [Sulfurimonas sp. RIFOXYD12_FULL_33_39]|uniref:type II secretion system protein n=1 Tax=unclassified Sulfurimonas TaxID=2623549 RepID=UPI0008B8DE42|nr:MULTISPECIES: prepilin-type N-terminal cleavage/methylation domain-containing protein [unclassified Sulfurimonas]OHE10497.1 MAG: protein containing prepilin-type N- cleavage/methylation domain protein [Sulfurimonas sp. RIFOXYD12_FULL_33_39]OHE14956.1 MAG: protein containing prepilin-type N- cleavage/methylation domain protein [Sulfurimonas sp. RIFOXYD2_FULL_34_21]DAB28246.1 MAG TPA: protein containing prepilin-type N- cleavage/methylation domain protein [Sulfurimonas sp. UBA10385]